MIHSSPFSDTLSQINPHHALYLLLSLSLLLHAAYPITSSPFLVLPLIITSLLLSLPFLFCGLLTSQLTDLLVIYPSTLPSIFVVAIYLCISSFSASHIILQLTRFSSHSFRGHLDTMSPLFISSATPTEYYLSLFQAWLVMQLRDKNMFCLLPPFSYFKFLVP